MATGTVKVDQMATDASSSFLKIINQQLGPAFSQLISNGNTLADPTHWSGGSASTFQNSIWPQAKQDIQNMQKNLTDLQGKVDKILKNIKAAGGS